MPNQTIALATLHAGFSHSSLALRCLMAACRDEPFYENIRLHEPTVKADLTEVAAAILADGPALVGFSTYLWNIRESLELARRVKAARPETTVVFGGPEAGPRAAELLAAEPALDYVVDGEGELAFRTVARRVFGYEHRDITVPGLVWREADGIRREPPAPVPVAELRSPYLLGLLDANKPLVYWETSRGCPFKCSFCTSAEDRLRAFPEARVDAELALLSRLEQKTVKLLDRSFHLGTARTLRLLESFLATPDSLCFHLELNPDRISAEALALFAKAPPGKFQFEIGLQTLDAGVLDRINRQMDVDKGLANITALIAGRRHRVHLDLIAGLPGEDEAHCRDAFDRVFALFCDHLQLGTLKLLPGTPLRSQAEAFGYDFDREPPYEVRSHRELSAAAFARLKAYGELTERLWNSGLLRHTLMRLVTAHYRCASELFDALLTAVPVVAERPSPEVIFESLAEWLEPRLIADPVLAELFAWDFGHFTVPGKRAPAIIMTRKEWQRPGGELGRRLFPVYTLSPAAAALVNRLRLDPLAPGRYLLWLRKHLRGRPVTVIPAS